jgi:hypothetical protein
VNPSLRVTRAEAERAFVSMTKVKGVPESAEGVLTYDGRNCTIRLPGFETAIQATGFWPGQARVRATTLLRIGKAPLPEGDPIVLEVVDNKLRLGSLQLPCTWDTGADSRIELPLNPPLISALRVARRYSPDEIKRSGLLDLASKAEVRCAELVAEATGVLAVLGVQVAAIERVVAESVAQADRPLSMAELQEVVGSEEEEK